MSLNFGTLTLYARASPATYIGIDTRPYESGNDELLGCSDSWMRQTVKRVKYRASPCQWDKRALCSCGCVTVEWGVSVSQWDSFYDQSRGWRGL